MRDQVTGDANDLWGSLGHPGNSFRACPVSAGERRAEMEVGEMCDAQSVKSGGQALDLHVEHSGAQPAGFEPPVDDARAEPTHENGSKNEHLVSLGAVWIRRTPKRCVVAQAAAGESALASTDTRAPADDNDRSTASIMRTTSTPRPLDERG